MGIETKDETQLTRRDQLIAHITTFGMICAFESSKIIFHVNVLITDFKWPHLISFHTHFQTMYRKTTAAYFRMSSISFAHTVRTNSMSVTSIWPMLWYKSKCGVSHLIKHETTQSPFLWWLFLRHQFRKEINNCERKTYTRHSEN